MQNWLKRGNDPQAGFYRALTKKYNNTFRKSLRVKSKLTEMPEMPTSLALLPQRPGRVMASFGIAPATPRTGHHENLEPQNAP
jgi:hypothetical protein